LIPTGCLDGRFGWVRGFDHPTDDRKPMTTIGDGVKEIRIRDASGAFRVIYAAKAVFLRDIRGGRPCKALPGAADDATGDQAGKRKPD
jgi:hypothetical protein